MEGNERVKSKKSDGDVLELPERRNLGVGKRKKLINKSLKSLVDQGIEKCSKEKRR